MRSPVRFHAHHAPLIIVVTVLWGVVLGMCGIFLALQIPQLPLWYSLVEPAEQLAELPWLAAPALLATGILFTSLLYARRTDIEHEEYLAKLSLWGGVVLLSFLVLSLLRLTKILL